MISEELKLIVDKFNEQGKMNFLEETIKAKAHGLSLSAFFRLAADEYMNNHNW